MPGDPNKFSQFWQELKRRNVVRVITVYAGAAFVIIELINNITEPLRLPEWTPTLVIVLLAIGFPIVIIFSWIFDLTPEGIEKTRPIEEQLPTKNPSASISWKIATYVSLVIILILLGFQIFSREKKPGKSNSELYSIAVLPFTNISENPGQEYFVEGITETLITELARISALKVITVRNSSNAASWYAQRNDIDAFLEGSALLFGDQVRVTARLIDRPSGEALWANQFDRELKDVLNLHSDLVNKITTEINVYLTKEEESYLASRRITEPEVYKLYLKGRYHIGKRNKQGLANAIICFEDAAEKDPHNAYIFSGLADAYTLSCEYGFMPSEEAYPKALAAAGRAIQLNDRIAETHTSLAYVKFMFEWDWTGAEAAFQKAIEINPNYATAHQWYSFFLILQDRAEESIKEQKLALELDPLSLIINKGLGHRMFLAGQHLEAIEVLSQTLEIDPDFAPAYRDMGFSYLELGNHGEAIKALERTRNITDDLTSMNTYALGYGYGIAGKTDEALEILEQYKLIAEERYVSPYIFACLYLGLNEREACFRWLNIAYEERDPSLVFLKTHPIWNPVRSDPGFLYIYHKMWPGDK